MYADAGKLAEAVEMYNKAGRWADAYKLATEYFGADQSRELYRQKAAQLAEEKKFTDAEEVNLIFGIFLIFSCLLPWASQTKP